MMKSIFFLYFAVACAFNQPPNSLRALRSPSRSSAKSPTTVPNFGARPQTEDTFAINNGEDTVSSHDAVGVALRAVAQKAFPFWLSLVCVFAPPTTPWSSALQHANAAVADVPTTTVSPTTTERVRPATVKSMLTVATFPQRPSDPIVDMAGVLDQRSSNILHEQIEAIQRDSQSDVMIVVTDEIQFGLTPKAMAETLFRNWKLGKDTTSDNDSAILVLAVLQKRRVEIEVSRGPLDTIMSSQWCTSMLKHEAVPSFRNENYGNGLIYTTRTIAQRLQEEDIQVEKARAKPQDEIMSIALFCGSFAVILAVSAFDREYPNKESCPECEENFLTWAYDDKEWNTVIDATDERPGKMELPCRCKKCNYQTKTTKRIRQYDGREVSDTGIVTYYFNDSGNSDGDSGGDSSDGGGGADW